MANMKSLAKDTAIYGLSSIVGRFLNYLLVPLYTYYMPHDTGDYGISTNVYAYVALILVILTFGMETSLFRFANDEKSKPDTVFSTAMAVVATLTTIFLLLLFGLITPISNALGYTEHPDYLLMMGVVVALDALQAIPFSFLRFQKRALRFASLKMLFIVFNIGLNVLYFVVLGKTSVFYVFFINLLCTAFITLFFIPDLFKIQWKFDGQLLRQMFSYSWPILILGIAGILNQVADKILFPLVYPDGEQANILLGDYGSCVKIAMIMAMITMAFRYAYEPIVFAKSKDADKTEYYAAAMKYFLIFTLLAYLCVVGWMPLLQYILGDNYREGLGVVPIVMLQPVVLVQAHRQDHLRCMVLAGRLSGTLCRQHHFHPQVRLLGLCVGWCGRLWHCNGAELYRRTEEEPHPLSCQGYVPLCADYCGVLLPDAIKQRVAYGGGTGFQHSVHRTLCGLHHL